MSFHWRFQDHNCPRIYLVTRSGKFYSTLAINLSPSSKVKRDGAENPYPFLHAPIFLALNMLLASALFVLRPTVSQHMVDLLGPRRLSTIIAPDLAIMSGLSKALRSPDSALVVSDS